ncbi:heterokaryon incompatibility protein-domain-containing protein [Pestalotiopsis sp. NC0098]|nr:heterokaryon incompatibility protein-domain-containing protein [Pestalotiopsis sp. NC0098]
MCDPNETPENIQDMWNGIVCDPNEIHNNFQDVWNGIVCDPNEIQENFQDVWNRITVIDTGTTGPRDQGRTSDYSDHFFSRSHSHRFNIKRHGPFDRDRLLGPPSAKPLPFRLFEIEQQQQLGDSPITGQAAHATTYRLRDFDFPDHPRYEALSYVWGSERPETDKIITINGTKQNIRANLYEALTSWTQAPTDADDGNDAPRYLWVDALCINQSNTSEKSKVVPHMGQIYAHASRVLAWLGPFEQGPRNHNQTIDSTELAQSACENVLSALENYGQTFLEHFDDDNQPRNETLKLDHVLEKFLSNQFGDFSGHFPFDAYTSLSKQPYWSRIWVLQEVYLANDLQFFCGTGRFFPMKQIAGGVLLIETFQQYILASESSSHRLTELYPSLRRFVFENPALPDMHRLLLYTTIYPSDAMSLRVALTNFCVKELPHGSKATNPSDMIFGLLGFATPKERQYLKANYRVPVQSAYEVATFRLISHGFTDILAWAQTANKRVEWLPSWVPDYSSTIHNSLCSHSQAKPWLPHFNAGGPPPAPRTLRVSGGTLILDSAWIDSIAEVGNIWNPQIDDRSTPSVKGRLRATQIIAASYKELLSFLLNVRDLCDRAQGIRQKASLGSLPEPPPADESVWRVPCADQLAIDDHHVRSDSRARDMHAQLLEALTRDENDSRKDIPTGCRPYIESLLRFTHRRPFITEKGYIGLGPENSMPGDRVLIFSGFSAIYLAKRERTWSGNEVQHYGLELVGEAYVDGLMDNEAAQIRRHPEGLV